MSLFQFCDENGHWVTPCRGQAQWFSLLGFISVGSHRRAHAHIYIIHSYLLLVLIIAPFVFISFPIFTSLWAWWDTWHIACVCVPCHCDFTWPCFSPFCLQCVCLWTKDVPAFSLPDMWRHCLSRQNRGKEQTSWWWRRKWEYIECERTPGLVVIGPWNNLINFTPCCWQ